MKIAIGNDHAAVELKKTIMEYVESLGHEVTKLPEQIQTKAVIILYMEKK